MSSTIPKNGRELMDALDSLFAENNIKGAGELLTLTLEDSRKSGDKATELCALNELVGFHRRTGDTAAAKQFVAEALALNSVCSLDDTPTGATTLLNCATTLKAVGEAQKAMPLYEKALEIYTASLSPSDFRLAGFYNNYGLALYDLGKTDEALISFEKALNILSALGGNEGEKAVTLCNAASIYGYAGQYEKENALLDEALELLFQPGLTHDGLYAFQCEKCSDAYKSAGRFSDQWRLEEIAGEIYENNRKK